MAGEAAVAQTLPGAHCPAFAGSAAARSFSPAASASAAYMTSVSTSSGSGSDVIVTEARLEQLGVIAINAQRGMAIAAPQQDVCETERLKLLDLADEARSSFR
ncbi:MAG TPA: hypothetical protein VLV78_01030 [Thermoanaerobaculia bacterium]|nr:hypothetical protein [Thermoanaerobaculia bacterium]